jgi:nitroreductase
VSLFEFVTGIDEMDALEAIRKRKSIRRYKDDAIPKADLETIKVLIHSAAKSDHPEHFTIAIHWHSICLPPEEILSI